MKNTTILIPVYNNIEGVLDCLRSIERSDANESKIVLVDDGSQGESFGAVRDECAENDRIRIFSNVSNRGYTRSVNLGLEMVDTEFVCVLNSDILVPTRWMAKLLTQIRRRPDVAAVGPLSNAASYQSIPDVLQSNGQFSENDGLGWKDDEREKVNRILEVFFSSQSADLPILNGFCTVFRRAAIQKVGGLDTGAFPIGYGEENDLCFRLKAEGYRLSAALDCFLHHVKSQSFGGNRASLVKMGSQALQEKYGKSFISQQVSSLEKIRELSIVRQVVRECLKSPSAFKTHESFLGEEGLSMDLDNEDKIITLIGPGTFSFTKNRVLCLSKESSQAIHISNIKQDSMTVSLPEGENARFASHSPVFTLLCSIAMRSQSRDVHISDFCVDASIPENFFSSIPFGALYFRPNLTKNTVV